MIKRYIYNLVALVIPTILLLGCSDDMSNSKQELVMAFTPSRNVNVVQKSANQIANELSRRTGLNIKSRTMVNYSAIIIALKRGDVDIAFLGPLSYLKAKDMVEITPITASVRNGQAGYYGVIISNRSSGIHDLEDLRDKSVAFADSLSTSGYLYPRYAMLRSGVHPSRDVRSVAIASHATIVLSVLTNKVDAGATYLGATSNPEVLDKIPDAVEQTKIIWKSPLIPPDVQVVRASLDHNVRHSLIEAFLAMSVDPKSKKWLKDLYGIDELVPMSNEILKSHDVLEEISKYSSITVNKEKGHKD